MSSCFLDLVRVTLFPLLALSTSTLTLAKDFKVCLAELPSLAEPSQHGELGILVDLVKAMRSKYGEGGVQLEITPFARSLKTLEAGGCDMHLPILNNPDAPFRKPNLRLASDIIFKVPFVIYSRSDRPPLAVGEIPGPRLETDLAHIRFFPFPISGTSCLACSLKKVLAGRTDGVIFAAKEMNTLIREEKLTGLRATLYRQFDVHPVVRQGPAGDEAERVFHQLLGKLKESGEYARIMQPLLNYDWQQ